MKIRLVLFILFSIIGLLSCVEDRPAPQVLKTSERNLHFSGNGGVWLLTINSNTIWQIEGINDWCTVDKTEGSNTSQLVITVMPNDTKQIRSTTLQLISEYIRTEVMIQQDTASGDYHYKLPVVFHVLYSDLNDTTQNIKATVITSLIEKCNELYRNSINSVDMNLELIPVTQTPEGETLSVAGIDRIHNSTLAYHSSEKFLDKSNRDATKLLWNPNEYINVFVFTFTDKNVLGRSYLPYTPRQNNLPGLDANNTYYTTLPDYPHSITLNNSYIYEENAYKTLAHELGHYLGLYHVFNEDNCDSDPDYCEDTYSYNRTEYEQGLPNGETDTLTFLQKCQRISCEQIQFTSYNIMDYDYSYMNQFTADQYLRIRHVLENSPLIPGPKNIIVTKSLTEDVEPIGRTME